MNSLNEIDGPIGNTISEEHLEDVQLVEENS